MSRIDSLGVLLAAMATVLLTGEMPSGQHAPDELRIDAKPKLSDAMPSTLQVAIAKSLARRTGADPEFVLATRSSRGFRAHAWDISREVGESLGYVSLLWRFHGNADVLWFALRDEAERVHSELKRQSRITKPAPLPKKPQRSHLLDLLGAKDPGDWSEIVPNPLTPEEIASTAEGKDHSHLAYGASLFLEITRDEVLGHIHSAKGPAPVYYQLLKQFRWARTWGKRLQSQLAAKESQPNG